MTVRLRRFRALLAVPVVIAALACLALEAGVWLHDEAHTGPFTAEAPPGVSHVIKLSPPFACCVAPRADDNEHPVRSELKLLVNGAPAGPAHTQHGDIRKEAGQGFSHWGGLVIFALPPGTANSASTRLVLRYPLLPQPGVSGGVVVIALVLGAWLYQDVLMARRERIGAAVARAPVLLARAFAYASLAASLAYLASIAYALLRGWALPTTALIRALPAVEWAAWNEPFAAHVILVLAAFGAVLAWLTPLLTRRTHRVRRDELLLRRFLGRWGFAIVACAFVFSMSAIWAGLTRAGDFTGVSIGGLIAFSDAAAYWAGAHDVARDGAMNEVALRRPLAGAFRTALLLAGAYSTPMMLLLQALLVAATTFVATFAVWRWRGAWAGLAFFAATFIVVRTFVPTTLTEPLGLFWALFAVPFLIEGLRSRSLPYGLVGFAAMAAALMTRMGSMFTLPALLVWLAWHFREKLRDRARVVVASLALFAAVLGVNAIVEQAYGRAAGLTGSNFSYVLCGLSIGDVWSGCDVKYRGEGRSIPADEGEHRSFLYARAWENLKADPSVMLRRLYAGTREFVRVLPNDLMQGYLFGSEPGWASRNALGFVALAGLAYVFVRRRERGEVVFWLLVWASVLASAAFVYFDDGRRVLVASYPMLCVFLAMGFVGPRTVTVRGAVADRRLLSIGIATLVAAAALFTAAPWIAHRLSPAEPLAAAGRRAQSAPDQALVFGGRRMTGFLVVPDNAPRRVDIPSLHLSQFAAIVKQSRVEETYQGILHPEAPPLPFGFIAAPRLEKGADSYHLFLVPPHVLERRDVAAWRFELREWNRTKQYGPFWFQVMRADPLQP